MNYQTHLPITPTDVSTYVLLPGDPARVDIIGTFLNEFLIIGQNREFKIGRGIYNNRLITVCSTGIGCPSTAIAVEELINAGAKYLIRVGTCGGAWRRDIPAGILVIPIAAVRDEGTTDEYLPKGFPAVADFGVVQALRAAAERQNVPYILGINRTHDAFYGSEQSITKWGDYLKEKKWQDYDTPILSSDMETAALLLIASLYSIAAGAILAVNADPEPLKDRVNGKLMPVTTELNKDVTNQTVEKTIKVALEAICSLPN